MTPKFGPYKNIFDLQSKLLKLSKIFLESFGEDLKSIIFPEIEDGGWSPPADIFEDDQKFIIVVEIPGTSRENLNIYLSGNKLVLEGIKPIDEKLKKENFHLIENFYGKFKRTFPLPEDLDTERIDATYREGLLTIIIPKIKDKSISISIQS